MAVCGCGVKWGRGEYRPHTSIPTFILYTLDQICAMDHQNVNKSIKWSDWIHGQELSWEPNLIKKKFEETKARSWKKNMKEEKIGQNAQNYQKAVHKTDHKC